METKLKSQEEKVKEAMKTLEMESEAKTKKVKSSHLIINIYPKLN